MAEVAGATVVEQGAGSIVLSGSDGFKYLEFKPPFDIDRIIDFPLPAMSEDWGRARVWNPTSIDKDKATGGVARMGFFSDAFEAEGQTHGSYAEAVAKHIGYTVVRS